MGNDTIPYDHESYVRSNNWGIQFGVVVPLDGSISEMCKNLVKRQLRIARDPFWICDRWNEWKRKRDCGKWY